MKRNVREVMLEAREKHFSIGAFTAQNAEMIKTFLGVSRELSAPILVMFGQKPLQHLDMQVLVRIARTYEDLYSIPVYLHLDHSRNLEQISRAIELGFDSVMYDGSALPWQENVENTKEVVAMAKSKGIVVEGEIGKITGVEDDIRVGKHDANLTTVNEAKNFADSTGVDWLAVSIGTAHGWYRETPTLDFSRIRAIRAAVDIPIVMHGGSGLGDDVVRFAIEAGISKINVDTELRRAFMSGIADSLVKVSSVDDLVFHFKAGQDKLAQTVTEKLMLFGIH